LMAAASVHCCPSRAEQREGFGVVVLEAKRAGIPSVVTPSGALPSLIRHGVDGWVCPRFSAADIADGLEYFLSDPDRLRAAGAAAHASADQFSHERFVDGWSAVFAGTHA
jgi:glycosyltransferase involved in cell wall biosynthesis